MRLLRTSLWLIAIAAFMSGPVGSAETPRPAKPAGDPWSGTYLVHWVKGSPAAEGSGPARAIIRKADDADPAKVKPGEGEDLHRWSLGASDERDDGSLLRRFMPREYRDLNLTALHATGAIECLSGAAMFICRTAPGARILVEEEKSSGGELYPTRTGMFGVALHAGAFELDRS